jgi:phosphodiesterase/alkaline phosphatase D-like protein
MRRKTMKGKKEETMKPIMPKAWKMVFAQIVLVFLLLTCFMAGAGWPINVPTVTTGSATNVTGNSAMLNGTVNPNGSGFIQYYFQWGLTANYGKKTDLQDISGGTSTINVSANITGLTPNTTYHYQLWARGESGYWVTGKDMTFTTHGKPSATTKAATDISSNYARLNGTVNPNGISATHYWEYGTTTAYGSKTNTWGDGSGTSDANVWADVGSLPPHTTYHFRFVATNSAGTGYGADMTFTTTAPKPSVTTGPAASVTTESARVTGTVNPNGLPTTCHFVYGTTTNYKQGIGKLAAGNGTSNVKIAIDLTGLHPNTSYHYELVCENSSGIVYGSDMAFKTKSSLIQVK